MTKLYNCFLAFVLLIGCLCPVFSHQELVAHIYMDFASTPALAQLVDAVGKPEGEPKLFLWNRIVRNKNANGALQQINAQMHLNGIHDWSKHIYVERAIGLVKYFIESYPEHLFHIHFNERHYYGYFQKVIKQSIPKNKVKMYHLYEDSPDYFIWNVNDSVEQVSFIKQELGVDKVILYGYDENRLKKIFGSDEIVEIDFVKTALRLTAFQKEIISDIFGIDRYAFQELFKNKTVIFFDENDIPFDKMQGYIEQVIKREPQLKNYVWLYKNHPRRYERENRSELFDDYVSKQNVRIISNKITYEALILLGFQPNYMLGYSSSAFFSRGNSQILGYIPREEEYYLPLLLETKIVKPADVLK